MDRDAWDLSPDSVQRALEAFLPRSGGQVMREAFYGVRRFDDFVRHTGLTPAVLSARLKDLVENGLLERVPYREPGSRQRHEYRLTDRGRDLTPALVALMDWADRWRPGAHGPTLRLHHRECGEPVRATLVCSAGHLIERPGDLRAEPGPGARIVTES